jgi:hypothetical protein
LRIYIFSFYDIEADDPNPVVIVRELREDLAREIAEKHIEEQGHDHDDVELELVEEFDSRDRDLVYSTVENKE